MNTYEYISDFFSGIDDEDIKANALFEWLVENGDITGLDENSAEEKKKIEDELVELNSRVEDSEDTDEITEIYDRSSELEEKLEELNQSLDVYDIYKQSYTFYGLINFEVLDADFHGREYTVGTYSEMDEACKEYVENLIDDVGLDGFRPGYIDSYIDEEELKSFVDDYYESDIWENPEVYFNDDDFELTEKQVKRKEELETYIETLEELKSETEDEQSELEDEIEDPDEYSQKYDELQAKIDEIEKIMEETQEEIDGIEIDTDTPTQDMVDEVLNKMVKNALYDPADWIKEHGLDINNFIDKEKLAEGVAEDDGWGTMNGYDGNYDSITINSETYYIMRIN
jgi:molecular chaperone GrpE (heat shock protein)